MGCTNSAQVKDMAAEKASEFMVKNGGSGKIKKGVDNTIKDASNLDFKKAQEDLELVGESVKEVVQDGVDELMEKLNPSEDKVSSPTPEGDTLVEAEPEPEAETQSSPSSPAPNESDEVPAESTDEVPAEGTEEGTDEAPNEGTEESRIKSPTSLKENSSGNDTIEELLGMPASSDVPEAEESSATEEKNRPESGLLY